MDRSDWSSIFHAFDIRSHHNGYKPYVKGMPTANAAQKKSQTNKFELLHYMPAYGKWNIKVQRSKKNDKAIFDRFLIQSYANI